MAFALSSGPALLECSRWCADGVYSEAFDINNAGQVVGEVASSLGTRAFLWTSEAGLIDLNTKVTNLPGDVVLIGAFSIMKKARSSPLVEMPNVSQHQEVTADSHVHAGPTRDSLLTPQ